MIYHVLPGDAQVEEFKKSGIEGEIVVCREALVTGPIDAESLDEFWDQRARYILSEYGDDEIEYHEKVAKPLNRLTELDPEDEINLWFEYELFCSVNLWFCLSLVNETEATVYRIEPIGLDKAKRWDGFGFMDADDLKACFELRTRLTRNDVEVGSSLWEAYRNGRHPELRDLAKTAASAFPHINEVAAAACEQDIQPLEIVRSISLHESDFGKIFAEFKRRAGVYGYGDLQIQRLLDRLNS